MPEYILVQHAGSGRWGRASEHDLPDESALQELVKAHPETLPFYDLGGDGLPLLIVGRESTLGNGYADVIAVDPSGCITVIECKLARNPDAKRTVLGQVLGYGAYLWRLSYDEFERQAVRPYFDDVQRCHRTDLLGVPLAEAMQRFVTEEALGGNWTPDEFQRRVEDNLRQGRLRLAIVVDKVNDELRRTVEFLNECTGPQFQCVCAELRYFVSEDVTLLVPTLIGLPKLRPVITPPRRGKWTEEEFLAQLEEHSGQAAGQAARALLRWARQGSLSVRWGTGGTHASLVVGIPCAGGTTPTVFVVYSSGELEVAFAYLKPYPPFTDAARRRALLTAINGTPGLSLPPNSFDRRPSFAISLLENAAALERFCTIMEGVASALRAAR